MKLQFEIALDKLEEFSKKFLVLSNVKRLKLLLLLKKIDEPLPSAEIHRRAKGGGAVCKSGNHIPRLGRFGQDKDCF